MLIWGSWRLLLSLCGGWGGMHGNSHVPPNYGVEVVLWVCCFVLLLGLWQFIDYLHEILGSRTTKTKGCFMVLLVQTKMLKAKSHYLREIRHCWISKRESRGYLIQQQLFYPVIITMKPSQGSKAFYLVSLDLLHSFKPKFRFSYSSWIYRTANKYNLFLFLIKIFVLT